tara:strand:+ start:802 stop:1218 length:417 start_codon:yes stop_codon:yes gene_type:complete
MIGGWNKAPDPNAMTMVLPADVVRQMHESIVLRDENFAGPVKHLLGTSTIEGSHASPYRSLVPIARAAQEELLLAIQSKRSSKPINGAWLAISTEEIGLQYANAAATVVSKISISPYLHKQYMHISPCTMANSLLTTY